MQHQKEISSQRDLLALQNKKLNKAQETILKQHEEIKSKNELLEEEVAKKTKELVIYNQQLEQFAFAAAHNLRAPVARILGLGEILRHISGNEEEERQVIRSIMDSIFNLDTVIKDLNIILEVKTNINSQLTEVNFSDELKFIKSNLEKEIRESKCGILEYFQEAPSVTSVKAYVDSILFNLVSNALKYRSPNRKLRIILRTSRVGNFICLEVQDNGLGINLEKYGKDVFSLYKRFHTHTEGKGLGLHLVKMQAIAMGGRVEINSVPDQGSTFKVLFKKH